MSEESDNFRLIKDKPRSKKLNPRIDLAAMVSVSFLLIIFFMVTKELARPQAMDLGLPDKEPTCGGGTIRCGPCYKCDRIITLLLDNDNKIINYTGLLHYPEITPKKMTYGKNGIRKELALAKKRILKITGDTNRGAIVIIKPSKKSNFGNLVDILDEMAIAQIPTYTIINDLTPEEQKLLASK